MAVPRVAAVASCARGAQIGRAEDRNASLDAARPMPNQIVRARRARGCDPGSQGTVPDPAPPGR